MIFPKEAPGRDVLDRVGEDYRRRGYSVVIEPRGADLPAFLAGTTPDLIAHLGDEHVVVEVKQAQNSGAPDELNTIAERVGEQPGWRFVLMASRPIHRILPGEELISLDEQSVAQWLTEVRSLVERGHFEAALMLAWAATEAILRLAVADEEIPEARPEPRALLRRAVSDGLIGRDEYAKLNDAFRLRSAVVHGFRLVPEDHRTEVLNATESLSSISENLVRQLRSSA